MPSLAALALATPIFGFALTPPVPAMPAGALHAVPFEAATVEPDIAAETDAHLRSALETRRAMATAMTGLGIATLASMITTTVLSAIHFHDAYGFARSFQDTHCAMGTAIFQGSCGEEIGPDTVALGTTVSLYVTTAMLGAFMPDPLNAGAQPGWRGDRVRLHRAWQWVTTSLLIAQTLLGGIVASASWVGLDERNDFDALQVIAGTQLGVGAAAIASLGFQGALMLF